MNLVPNEKGFEKLKKWIRALEDKEKILIIKNKNNGGKPKIVIQRETECSFDEDELDIT